MRTALFAATVFATTSVALVCLTSCKKERKRFDTNVEVVQIRAFGKTTRKADIELRLTDCPGDVRKIVRTDETFAACGDKLKNGDKVPAVIEFFYNAEREQYRDELVHLGDCDVKLDPKDEANYGRVENCTELKLSGSTVGVHCDLTRSKELVEKCPWTYRK